MSKRKPDDPLSCVSIGVEQLIERHTRAHNRVRDTTERLEYGDLGYGSMDHYRGVAGRWGNTAVSLAVSERMALPNGSSLDEGPSEDRRDGTRPFSVLDPKIFIWNSARFVAWNFHGVATGCRMRKIAENRVRHGPKNKAVRCCGLGTSGRNARTRFDRVSARKALVGTLHKFTRHPHNVAKETEREFARGSAS